MAIVADPEGPLKGVFGLSDAPREWFLRLRKSLTKEGWRASTMDAASYVLPVVQELTEKL